MLVFRLIVISFPPSIITLSPSSWRHHCVHLAPGGSQVQLIEERYFWREWRKHKLKLKSDPGLEGPTLTQQVVGWQAATSVLRDEWHNRTLIRRKFLGYSEHMYSVCYPLYFLEKGLEWVRRDDIVSSAQWTLTPKPGKKPRKTPEFKKHEISQNTSKFMISTLNRKPYFPHPESQAVL